MIGLSLAFGVSQILYTAGPSELDQLAMTTEYLLFLGSLPVWVVVAKLYGDYCSNAGRPK